MAFVLDPAQEDLLQAEHSEGKMSPEKAAAWEAYLTQKPQKPAEAPVITEPVEPPPPLPEPPPKPPAQHFPPGDPRNDAPWYQRLFNTYALGQGLSEHDLPWSPPVLGTTKPGEQADARQQYQESLGRAARNTLEWGATLAPMTWGPRAALTATRWLPRVVEGAGQILSRAAKSGAYSGAASMLGNVVDPTTYTPPWEAAAWNAGGEGMGGVAEDALKGGLKFISKPFAETPEGTIHREVIERAGGEITPSMVNEGFVPRTMDKLARGLQTPGNRTNAVYEATHKKIQDEMKLLQAQHPGGKVTQEVTDIGQAVSTAGDPAMVTPAAKGVRSTVTKVIDDTNLKHVKNYEALDTQYRQYNAEWGQSQAALPAVTKAEDLLTDPRLAQTHQIAPRSIFHHTANLVEAMRNLPPTVTVDTLIDMQSTVNKLMLEAQKHIDEATAEVAKGNTGAWNELTTSIQKNVLSTLADTNVLLYGHLRPHMVDRGPAQEVAKKVVGAWEESLKTPETAMTKGGPGRMGVLEDPQVMAARAFIEKPKYGLFSDAHNDRSLWLKISRVPGPNLGNDIAREAGEVATRLDNAMTKTGEYATEGAAPGGQLEALRRATDTAYRKDAEVLNSPLMMDLAQKNLDDIINTFIQPGRVNDMKTLRATLGDNTMDNGAQMWLSRKMDEYTPASTRVRLPTDPPLGPPTGPGQLNNRALLADLDQVNAETAKVLFPHGNLNGIRNRLRQGVDMEDALAEVQKQTPNLTTVQQLKTRINDPQLWASVQSDALHPYLKGDVDGLKGATLLAGLEKMDNTARVLFDPGHLKDLQHLGQTMRTLDEGKKRTFHPLLRHTAGGLLLLGSGYIGGTDGAMGYFIGSHLLSRMLSNQKAVRIMTRGLATNASPYNWGEVVGGLLGTLHSQGLSREVVPIIPNGRVQVPDAQLPAPAVKLPAPTPRPAGQHHPEDTEG